MKFDCHTVIVLDVPEPIASQVMKIRKRHRDDYRMSLPVEITITGSNGAGGIDISQDSDLAITAINKIAAETVPIEAAFDQVIRFENTDIFVLTLRDEQPFLDLHHRFLESGIHFMPSEFPFQPHCTLRSRSPVSEEDVADLLAVKIPEKFILDTISVYMLRQLPLELLHRTRLAGVV